MNSSVKIGIIIVILVAVAGIITLKNTPKTTEGQAITTIVAEGSANSVSSLPRLIDLGAGKCIPCKMMAPILEELKKEFAGRMEVMFYDVWENPGIGEQLGIQIIPTQIFFDASGKELFRHEGFFSKEDILNQWEKLGVKIKETANENN